MNVVRLKSPAKLNLYLRILNKRPDGYHSIVTLFERIDLCDDLILRPMPSGIKIVCDNPKVPNDHRNLAYKAARVLLDWTGKNKGVRIQIVKHIPIAGGLGGGSSNAASTLVGLNLLWKLRLSKKILMEAGAKIGADVNFFLLDRSMAIGSGIGDSLIPLRSSRPIWHVLVAPASGFSTKEIYQQRDRLCSQKFTLTQAMQDVKILHTSLQKNDWNLVEKRLHNDLEQTAKAKDNAIAKIKDAMKAYGIGPVLMSGSGPCVFGIASSRKEAMRAKQRIISLDKRWNVFVVKTL